MVKVHRPQNKGFWLWRILSLFLFKYLVISVLCESLLLFLVHFTFDSKNEEATVPGSNQFTWHFPFTFKEGPSNLQTPSSSSPATALALSHAASCLCTSSANSCTISSSLVDNSPFNASSNSLTDTSHRTLLRQIESISMSYASKRQRRVSRLQQMPPHVLNCALVQIASWMHFPNSQQPGSLTAVRRRKWNTNQGHTCFDPTKMVNPLHRWSTHWWTFHLRPCRRLRTLYTQEVPFPSPSFAGMKEHLVCLSQQFTHLAPSPVQIQATPCHKQHSQATADSPWLTTTATTISWLLAVTCALFCMVLGGKDGTRFHVVTKTTLSSPQSTSISPDTWVSTSMISLSPIVSLLSTVTTSPSESLSNSSCVILSSKKASNFSWQRASQQAMSSSIFRSGLAPFTSFCPHSSYYVQKHSHAPYNPWVLGYCLQDCCSLIDHPFHQWVLLSFRNAIEARLCSDYSAKSLNQGTTYHSLHELMGPQLIVALLCWRGGQCLHLLPKESDDGLISRKHLSLTKRFVCIEGNDGRKEVRNVQPFRDLYCTQSSESCHSYVI